VRISLQLIKNSSGTPSPSTYRKRFGSLRHAYELIGYGKSGDFGPVDLRRRTQTIREDLMRGIQAALPQAVTVACKGARWRSYLRLRTGKFVAVLIARSIGNLNTPVWQVDPVPRECRYTTLLALLDVSNDAVSAIYLLPQMTRRTRFHLRTGDTWLNGGKELETVKRSLLKLKRLTLSRSDR
jgi:hypothetical protein